MMQICTGSRPDPHEEVVYTEDFCPVCNLNDEISELQSEKSDLSIKLEVAQEDIANLEEQIKKLENPPAAA